MVCTWWSNPPAPGAGCSGSSSAAGGARWVSARFRSFHSSRRAKWRSPTARSHAAAAIRLLLLTGCRKGEILSLRWDEADLDAGELRLPDSKTGPKTVVLSPEAVSVLSRIPRTEGNPHVIAGKVPGMPLRDLTRPWGVVRARAGLEDVRVHDLRHSYASRALALGESLPMIGRLLGHANVETTARYAHLSQDSVRDSAIRVSDSIAADLLIEPDHAAGAAAG